MAENEIHNIAADGDVVLVVSSKPIFFADQTPEQTSVEYMLTLER